MASSAQQEAYGDHVIPIFNFQAHRFILKMDKARQRFHRRSHRCLFANDECYRSKSCEAAALNHSQCEVLSAGCSSGSLEQTADAAYRYAHVLVVQASKRKSEFP